MNWYGRCLAYKAATLWDWHADLPSAVRSLPNGGYDLKSRFIWLGVWGCYNIGHFSHSSPKIQILRDVINPQHIFHVLNLFDIVYLPVWLWFPEPKFKMIGQQQQPNAISVMSVHLIRDSNEDGPNTYMLQINLKQHRTGPDKTAIKSDSVGGMTSHN